MNKLLYFIAGISLFFGVIYAVPYVWVEMLPPGWLESGHWWAVPTFLTLIIVGAAGVTVSILLFLNIFEK